MSKVIYQKNGYQVTEVYNGVELVEVIIKNIHISVENDVDEYGHYEPGVQYLDIARDHGDYWSEDTFTRRFDTYHGECQNVNEVIDIMTQYAL